MEANYNFKWSAGGGVANVNAKLPFQSDSFTCNAVSVRGPEALAFNEDPVHCCTTNGLPFCNSACMQDHRMRLAFNFKAAVNLKCLFKAEATLFKDMGDSFDKEYYITKNGLEEEPADLISADVQLATLCAMPVKSSPKDPVDYGKLFDHAKSWWDQANWWG